MVALSDGSHSKCWKVPTLSLIVAINLASVAEKLRLHILVEILYHVSVILAEEYIIVNLLVLRHEDGVHCNLIGLRHPRD